MRKSHAGEPQTDTQMLCRFSDQAPDFARLFHCLGKSGPAPTGSRSDSSARRRKPTRSTPRSAAFPPVRPPCAVARRPTALLDRCRGRAPARVVGGAGCAVKIVGGSWSTAQRLVGRRSIRRTLPMQVRSRLRVPRAPALERESRYPMRPKAPRWSAMASSSDARTRRDSGSGTRSLPR